MVVSLDKKPQYRPQNTTILLGSPKMVPLISGEAANIFLTMLRFQGCFAPQRPDSAGLLPRLGWGPGGSWSQNGINTVIMIVVKKNSNYKRSDNSTGGNKKRSRNSNNNHITNSGNNKRSHANGGNNGK